MQMFLIIKNNLHIVPFCYMVKISTPITTTGKTERGSRAAMYIVPGQ